MLTGLQIKMARIALGWDAKDLEAASGVSLATIFRIENGAGAYASTLATLQSTLERGGAVFIADRQPSPDGGPGVRLGIAAPVAVPRPVAKPKAGKPAPKAKPKAAKSGRGSRRGK